MAGMGRQRWENCRKSRIVVWDNKGLNQPFSATRAFPLKATNPDRQLYSNDGDARFILGVLIHPLSFSAIFFTAAILENSLVNGDFAHHLQIVGSVTARVRPRSPCRFTQTIRLPPPLPSQGRRRLAPAYHAYRTSPHDRESLLLRVCNI